MAPSLRDRFRRRPSPSAPTAPVGAAPSNRMRLAGSLRRSHHSASSSSASLSHAGDGDGGRRGGGILGGRRRGSKNRNSRREAPRPPLAAFDACVEACDALAARGAPLPQPEPREGGEGDGNDSGEARETECASNDEHGGGGSEVLSSDHDAIPDCSILVSPDGALLFSAGGRSSGALRLREAHNTTSAETGGGEGDHGNGNQNSINGTSRPPPPAAALDSEECDSAVATGHDLSPLGDRSLNGFSARGWHDGAATSALAASRDALHNLLGFVEDIAAIHKEGGARLEEARDGWGSAQRGAEGVRGGGPLGGETTGVGRAMAALGEFYGGEAGSAGWWARACSEGQRRSGRGESGGPNESQPQQPRDPTRIDGLLPALRTSAQHAARRTSARERALAEIRWSVAEAQGTLHNQKRWARQCHARVAEEEANVDRLFAVKKMEHHEAYEEWRRRQEGRALRTAGANETTAAEEGGRAATEPEAALSDDIWEMVRDVGAMESFGHTGYSPTAAAKQPVEVGGVKVESIPPPPSPPRGSARIGSGGGGGMPAPHDHLRREQSPPPRLVSRADVERESDLADLRAVARAADESVEDAAGKLLNAMAAADTTQRSARLAAETCLLSECNAARGCLRSLVAMERAALEDKRARLAVLEAAVDAIDVRADIDGYVTADKARPGGRSRAGEEDDGGVAAALAVLHSHCQGEGGGGAGAQRGRGRVERGDYFEGWGGDDDGDGGHAEDDDDGVGPELFTDIIRRLFDEGAADASATDSPDSDERLALATKALAEKTARGQSHRKSVLYELNQQRSQRTRVGGREKFDALCRIFDAFLAGCGREPVDVAQAKMLMILASTFYLVDDDETETETGNNGDSKPTAVNEGTGGTPNDRHDRLYVKSRIAHHALWSDPSFWDQAVYQCVSESLAKSGVLVNYVGATAADGPGGATRDPRDARWHDLPPAEYAGAAAQVHSVVFAQLGTLSHSMIELGCGIPMAVGFVRRLSIRYQLPLSLRITLIQHLTRKQGDGNAS